MATVRFQEAQHGCAAMGGPSIGEWGQCTMDLCRAEHGPAKTTVYYPTRVRQHGNGITPRPKTSQFKTYSLEGNIYLVNRQVPLFKVL